MRLEIFRGAQPGASGARRLRRLGAVLGALLLLGAGVWALAGRGGPGASPSAPPAAPAAPPAPVGDGTARAVAPRRVVSLNLCTDQLVLALADRAQIAGLTRNATDPQMSAAAAQAHGLPVVHGSAEEIAAIDPDLVIGQFLSGNPALAALPGRHYPRLDLPPVEDYPAILASIRQVAAALGHRDRGEALVARMNREMAVLGASPGQAPGRGRVAAYYQRRGYLTGTGTLVDDLMRRVGLVNLAARLGKPALAQIPLEEMVAAQPDFLIVESATDHVRDQGTEMLHHPALARFRRIGLPQAWTVCGGPAYARAARHIARQLEAGR